MFAPGDTRLIRVKGDRDYVIIGPNKLRTTTYALRPNRKLPMSDDLYYEDPFAELDETGITELLDLGYQQLDRYVEWSESALRLDSRIAQQDVFNAEALMDYLANQHRKAIADMNEYELRWFVFSHYIRKAMADAETEERLLSSLERFMGYLARMREVEITDWMRSVLDEASYYHKRRAAYHLLSSEDEREWKLGFKEWCAELDDDLDSRCLLIPADLGDGLTWSDNMGWREATLRDEANAIWQRERDQLLIEGMSYDQIRDQLMIAYFAWADTPQARLEGLSPSETILAERLETPEADEDDGLDE